MDKHLNMEFSANTISHLEKIIEAKEVPIEEWGEVNFDGMTFYVIDASTELAKKAIDTSGYLLAGQNGPVVGDRKFLVARKNPASLE